MATKTDTPPAEAVHLMSPNGMPVRVVEMSQTHHLPVPDEVRELINQARREKRGGARDATDVWLMVRDKFHHRTLRPSTLTYEPIGDELGVSESTAKRAVGLLVSLGLMERKQHRYSGKRGEPGTAGNYLIALPFLMTAKQAAIRLPDIASTSTAEQAQVSATTPQPPAEAVSHTQQRSKTSPTTGHQWPYEPSKRSPVTPVISRELVDSSLEQKKKKSVSKGQLEAIDKALDRRDLSRHLAIVCELYGIVTLNDLTWHQADELIQGINSGQVGTRVFQVIHQRIDAQSEAEARAREAAHVSADPEVVKEHLQSIKNSLRASLASNA